MISFDLVSSVIRAAYDAYNEANWDQERKAIEALAIEMAWRIKANHPRFDRYEFLRNAINSNETP